MARELTKDEEEELLSLYKTWQERESFRQKFSVDYVGKVFGTIEPGSKFKPNWHHGAICEYLQAVWDGEIKRLLINEPPRELKSIQCCVAFPSWGLGMDPGKQFMCGSYADKLALKHSVNTRYICKSAWFQSTFPDFEMAPDQNEKFKFMTKKFGHRVAVTVGGTVVGEGGDILVIDDPIKREHAFSDAHVETAKDWIQQTMPTRLNDPETGAIVMVMQRFSRRDPSGVVLDTGEWTHVKMPRIAPKTITYKIRDFKHTYKKGETLNPTRVSKAQCKKIRNEIGSIAWAGQQQQDPVAEGGAIFEKQHWKYYRNLPLALEHMDEVAMTWDCAFKDTKSSSYVVGQVWARLGIKKYLVHQVRKRLNFPNTIKAMIRMIETYPEIGMKLVEEKANGAAVISMLKEKVPGMVPFTPDQDKTARAYAWSPMQEAGEIYLPDPNEAGNEWVNDFITEHTDAPGCKDWDQIDAAGQLMMKWKGRGAKDLSDLYDDDDDLLTAVTDSSAFLVNDNY